MIIPRLTGIHLNLRQQHSENLSGIRVDRNIRLFDLADLRTVDIHMNNFGIRAELLRLADRTVIKARPDHNQQIRFLQNHIGITRPVHPQHAQIERMLLRDGA